MASQLQRSRTEIKHYQGDFVPPTNSALLLPVSAFWAESHEGKKPQIWKCQRIAFISADLSRRINGKPRTSVEINRGS
jgi:hypothetical protein